MNHFAYFTEIEDRFAQRRGSLLLLSTLGSTFGQRLLGLQLVDLSGRPANVVQVALRTVLLCLAVPALIWDRDQRGLHDKAAKTVLVRR